MYTSAFKLKELPFRLSPDPQFLFLSRAHARAKAYMESTIWFTDGFVIITGDIGAGKTTLIESFLRQLDSDVVIAQINQTQINAIEFLQSVLAQFGFSPFKMKKAELIATINSFLIEQYAAGRKVLLIIDEAQNLSPKVLEEIRLLSGIESTKEKVLRIILAGQPELNQKLDSPELIQLALKWKRYDEALAAVRALATAPPDRLPHGLDALARIDTSLDRNPPDTVRFLLALEPIAARVPSLPREIADPVVYLASDKASYITGQTIVVDGGWTIQGMVHVADWLKPELAG